MARSTAVAAVITTVAVLSSTASYAIPATSIPDPKSKTPIAAMPTARQQPRPTVVATATIAPTRTSTPAPTPIRTPAQPLPMDDLTCSELSDVSLLSADSPYCVDAGEDLLSQLGANGEIQPVAFKFDDGKPVKPPRKQYIPKSPKELADIINSSCRTPDDKANTIPPPLEGAKYYNLRSWCCQQSAYLTVVAADLNRIRSEMLRGRWNGGWHIFSGHECYVDGKLRVVVMNYGVAVGYLAPCGRGLCVYNFNGTLRGDFGPVERWRRESCKRTDVGTYLPTSPGDVSIRPGPKTPDGKPFWCRPVKLPDGSISEECTEEP